MSDFLKNHWQNLTSGLPQMKDECLQELISLYSSKNRFYHNLKHIEALLVLSKEYEHFLNSPRTIGFVIWYHDAIYDGSKSNNEEKSAELAKSHLTQLGLNNELIETCCDLIITTKTHQLSKGLDFFDAQFLLDIDLSILGVEREQYIEYTKQIRKEYKMYPDFLYNKGRKKVLEHFLEMENIYKTVLFQNLWEEKAKENLFYEITLFNS